MKCNSIIKSNKVLIHDTQNKSQKYYVQRKKPKCKRTHIVWCHLHKTTPKKANLDEEKIVFFCNLSVNGHKGSFGGDEYLKSGL